MVEDSRIQELTSPRAARAVGAMRSSTNQDPEQRSECHTCFSTPCRKPPEGRYTNQAIIKETSPQLPTTASCNPLLINASGNISKTI
uniref:Uncharacterized protein n=1 Tax=Arundo donax TaxID=35708 RepID=A0A0A9BFK5_ARUDO